MTTVTCEDCKERLAGLEGAWTASNRYDVGNAANVAMGHQMYFTRNGRVALCVARKASDLLSNPSTGDGNMTTDLRSSPKLRDLKWYQMPQDGGQIVDVTYACDEYYLYCCRHDRSDNSYSIERVEWDQSADDDDLRFEPWNGRLPRTDGDWKPI